MQYLKEPAINIFITWDIQKSSCLIWTMYGYCTNWKNILPFQGVSWLFHWES